MRVLVIEQDPSEKAAAVGAALERRGYALHPFLVQTDHRIPHAEVSYPDPGKFDVILSMGSPWSVYDRRVASWLDPQLELLAGAVDAGIPVLGICFGAQALAAALGGTVTRAIAPEVGWIDVESSLEAVRGRWFQWHQDVFTVPDGAEVLATSPAGPQVFRRGSGVAVQFHPEVDSHHMRLWMASGGASEIANHGLDPEALVAETAALDDAMRPRIENLVDWFLDNAG